LFQPSTLWSSTKILADQHGNCFDYANLLCSLLIGAGYDAYIVSGYATREICYMDTTRLQNPYIRKRHEVQFLFNSIKNILLAEGEKEDHRPLEHWRSIQNPSDFLSVEKQSIP